MEEGGVVEAEDMDPVQEPGEVQDPPQGGVVGMEGHRGLLAELEPVGMEEGTAQEEGGVVLDQRQVIVQVVLHIETSPLQGEPVEVEVLVQVTTTAVLPLVVGIEARGEGMLTEEDQGVATHLEAHQVQEGAVAEEALEALEAEEATHPTAVVGPQSSANHSWGRAMEVQAVEDTEVFSPSTTHFLVKGLLELNKTKLPRCTRYR